MTIIEPDAPIWRKSSYSNGGSACVEVALEPVTVAVRDSKRITGPTLTFNHSPWQTFLNQASNRHLDQ